MLAIKGELNKYYLTNKIHLRNYVTRRQDEKVINGCYLKVDKNNFIGFLPSAF